VDCPSNKAMQTDGPSRPPLGEAADLSPRQLHDYISLVEKGELKVKRGPVFQFE